MKERKETDPWNLTKKGKKKKEERKGALGGDFSVNTSRGGRGRARKSRNRTKEREAQSAARITGSILSCDSSRFDYEALAFAPHLPPDRVYLPPPPADDLTPRPVTPRPRYSDYIQTRRPTSKLPRNVPPPPSSSATPSTIEIFNDLENYKVKLTLLFIR